MNDLSCIECPVKFFVSIAGGKWKLAILLNLSDKGKRFNQIQEAVYGITPRMLIKELKELEEHNLIKREVFAETPVLIIYSLTAQGKSLQPLIGKVVNWSVKQMKSMKKHSTH